jgi:hypothetical protein
MGYFPKESQTNREVFAFPLARLGQPGQKKLYFRWSAE